MGMAVYKTKDGRWVCQYRVRSKTAPVKEYFGRGLEGKRAAEIREAEVKLAKKKKQHIRPTSAVYLDELAQLYLDDARVRGKSPRWREEFATLLNKVILPVLTHRPVDHLEYVDILDLASKWEHLSRASTSRYMGYLKALFRFGVNQEITTRNPMSKWKRPNERKRDMKLTVEDLIRIYQAAAPHLQWAIETEWELGTRPGITELLSLQWADVDFENNTIHVRGTKTENAERLIPITSEFRSRLLEMKRLARTECLVEYQGRPVKRIQTSFESAVKRAGITYKARPYDIRHLFASVKLAGGADLAAVSQLLGHADISTTQRAYYHLLRGEKERAVAISPSIRPEKRGKVVRIG